MTIIGVPRETKPEEGRVSMTPSVVKQLVELGHQVRIECSAGESAGFSDQDYSASGADLVKDEKAWNSDLVVKVKEPISREYPYLRGQMLFTFLHLSGVDRLLTERLISSRTTALGYETLEDGEGRLPILAPMSAIAGNVAVQAGAHFLAKPHGGRGTQLGEVLGIPHGKVVIIGDGVVAQHAASSALGLGAKVVLLGLDEAKVSSLLSRYGDRICFLRAPEVQLADLLPGTDLLIGAVLRKGSRADSIVKRDHIRLLPKGSVVVDVSIDQGGCIETSRPTSHGSPVFEVDGVIHYAVTNMPGAYPRTATMALSNAVEPYVLKLAQCGLDALSADSGFARSLQTLYGKIRLESVAKDLDMIDLYAPNPYLAG